MSYRILASLSVVTLAVLAACSDSTSPDTTAPRTPDVAPATAAMDVAALQGPGEYIVVLKDEMAGASTAAASVTSRGGRIKEQWQHALRGFLAELPAGAAAELARRPDVAIVEKNGLVTTTATQFFPPSWGLDRIDQRFRPLNNAYTYNKTGLGVHAYIIDTGIRAAHADFAGRVLGGITVIADGNGTNDCNGHGTHVAGTVGGTAHGVAKRVWLHPIRVLNCAGSGTFAGVIAGVNWVAANRILPAVANISLGGGFSLAVNAAVNNLVNANVATAVAAGNESMNACNRSPASAANPLTVGATNSLDQRAGFSNFGGCLDLFAPGVGIRSAWNTSNVATAVLNGTSMAAPHVAGAAALLRQAFPLWTAFQIQNTIRAQATVGVVVNAGLGSPNRLLYTGFIP